MSDAPAIQLAEPMQAFVHRQVEEGRYASADAVVDAGLRMLDDYETRLTALRAALDEGEASGEPQPLDFEEFLARMHAKYPRR